ncbi:MAG: Ppx/GppA family phosphatase [Pseudomonadota bacterium]
MSAVIDIGSNSVRLVMYGGPKSAPIMIFNEKILCGLGRRDPKTGNLLKETTEEALSVLARFRGIVDLAQPKDVIVFATAGVRDAANGAAFLMAVQKIGFQPILFSGDEEARLAALGIIAGTPDILESRNGALAGDIGGGSLELCHVGRHSRDGVGPRISLPLGGLRLFTLYKDNKKAAKDEIKHQLKSVPWLHECSAGTLYAVGGAWRALGRIAIDQQRYPISILEGFSLSRGKTIDLCHFIGQQSVASIEAISGVQRKRAPTLPFAAMVMEELFKLTSLDRLVFSASGLREGVLFDRLHANDRKTHPLLALAHYVAMNRPTAPPQAPEVLLDFLSPVFPEWSASLRRHWLAAIILSNAVVHLHPEFRAKHIAELVMGLPFHGLDHLGRVRIAATLYHRHGGSIARLDKTIPLNLMTEEDQESVLQMGSALRFVCGFDPSGGDGLKGSQITLDGDKISLALGPDGEKLWGRAPAKRFARFASVCGLSLAEDIAEGK